MLWLGASIPAQSKRHITLQLALNIHGSASLESVNHRRGGTAVYTYVLKSKCKWSFGIQNCVVQLLTIA